MTQHPNERTVTAIDKMISEMGQNLKQPDKWIFEGDFSPKPVTLRARNLPVGSPSRTG
jgi:hypothetical protein